jgi:diguanylate cyclase (GGDEF)-like protein
VVEDGAPLEVVDARTHPKVRDNPSISEFGIVAYLGVPLTTADGERLGALCAIDHEPRQWTGRDHGVLEDLAGAAMAEVELRRANRRIAAAAAELHFAATHDTLTRLGNRRALLADLAQLLAERRPATLALLDLQGVRGFNDAHGHLAGDELLTRLAARVDEAMVGHGQVYRLGGVQLCALIPAVGALADAVVAAASGALDERGAGYAVVCRAVTVELPREAANVAAALRLADARLARYGHVAATRG